jgi:hypothetical protein
MSTDDNCNLPSKTIHVCSDNICSDSIIPRNEDVKTEQNKQLLSGIIERPKLSLLHPDTIGTIDDNSQSDKNTTSSNDNSNSTSKESHYYRNREKILAYAKLRYKENRERLLEYSKAYQRERKDQVKTRNTDYYAKNRERLLKDRATKIHCECGKTITKGSLATHLKTKYHLKRVNINDDINDNTQENAEKMAISIIE